MSRPWHSRAVLAACLLAAGAVCHGDVERRLYPVPVFIENENVLSGLHIELATREIGQPLEVFLSRAEGLAEEALADFLAALLAGDTSAALALTREAPHVPMENNRPLLEGYGRLLGQHRDRITVGRETLTGPDTVFTLLIRTQGAAGERAVARSLRFVQAQPGVFRFEGIQRDPFGILINDLYQTALDAGGLPEPRARFAYSYDIPGTAAGELVRFHFNGHAVDFDPFDPGANPAHPALAVYARAWSAFMAGDLAGFAAHWTEFSRRRILEWAPDTASENYQRVRQVLRNAGRRVKFLLDADPVYFVFHHVTDPLAPEFRMRYDVMYVPPGGPPVLANFFTEGYIDDILKEPGFFEEPFLRPLLASLGTAPGPDSSRVEELAAEVEAAALEAELAARPAAVPGPLAAAPPAPVDSGPPAPANPEPLWPWLLAFAVLILVAILLLRRKRRPDTQQEQP